MRVALFAGIVLQMVGLSTAIWGISETYREALDRRLLPDMWKGTLETLKRVLPWMKDLPARETVGTDLVIGWNVEESKPVRPQLDDRDRTVEGRLDAIEALATDIVERLDADRERADAQAQRLRQGLNTVAVQAAADVEAVQVDVAVNRRLLIGPDGKGLRRAAAGLMLTMFGMFLTLLSV